MELTANAKINLTLDILRKREDGYHELQMVMQAVTLADQLTVAPAKGPEGDAVADLRFLPTGNKNLAQVAAAVFRQATGLGGEVDVSIRKRVPVCAGLAGGSADAAAVLRAMNALTGAGLSLEELARIGARAGSDVPFCVLGGTALAEGRGERLTPQPPQPPRPYGSGHAPLAHPAARHAALPYRHLQAPLLHLHPPALWAGERAEDRPPPGHPGGSRRPGGRGSGGGGPAYV